MKNIILPLCLILSFLATAQNSDPTPPNCLHEAERIKECKEQKIRNKATQFPTKPVADYKVQDYQVKLALPIEAPTTRIWLKGSENFQYAQIFTTNRQAISEPIALLSPFFTKVVSIALKHQEVKVHFANAQSDLANSKHQKTAYPKSKASIRQEEEVFSMLFYGCFQPFKVEEGKSKVLNEKNLLNYKMRQTFKQVALEKELIYYPYQSGTTVKLPLIKNPKIVIGTGDQIYTDAGYKELDFANHPLSAWAHACNNPYPLLDETAYLSHLNNCYKHFNSFACFDEVFATLPGLNVWDDHEIRDGWGSHGDEYDSSGKISAPLKNYYQMSREAFVAHQYAVGPNEASEEIINTNGPLHQATVVNGIDVFAFDLRSNRNSCLDRVFDDSQFAAFQKWCDAIPDGNEAVIVSSIPMFYEQNKLALSLTGKLIAKGELNDDIVDSWASEKNFQERNRIIRELIKLRGRAVKPIIVSGDVHIGGMITVWYKNEKVQKNEKLCFELIYSGLSHESLGEARSQMSSGIQHRAEKPRVKDPTFQIDDAWIYPVYEFTRGKLNFGALEFSKGASNTKASLIIIGDAEKRIIERELELNWTETFDDYWATTTKPFHWNFIPWKWSAVRPPDVPFNAAHFSTMNFND